MHSEKKTARTVLWLESQRKEPHFSMMSPWEHGSDYLPGQQLRKIPVASLLLC